MIGHSVTQAAHHLIKGDIVAIPTETVYGLAGNAYDAAVVHKIYTLKKRPYSNPLIVHAADIAAIQDFALDIPPIAQALAKTFWPGPLTLLLPSKNILPAVVTSGLPTVGVRIPSHPLAQALLSMLPFPIAAPSANPFNYISPTTAEHVAEQLGDTLPYILDGGPCHVGVESTIIGDLDKKVPRIYRLGGIAIESIQQVIGEIHYQKTVERTLADQALASPGLLARHYAPNTPLIVGDLKSLMPKYLGKKIGALLWQSLVSDLPRQQQVVLGSDGSLKKAAKGLFTGLHYLDKLGCDIIIASPFPNRGLGKTIQDRLKRASNPRHAKQ